jgi:hypothetical protein
MKPAITFSTGLIFGAAVVFGCISVWQNASGDPARRAAKRAGSVQPVNSSAPAANSAPHPDLDARRQRAIQLLREAGMVVMRQDIAVYFTPSLRALTEGDVLGEAAIRKGLQLDDREVSGLRRALNRLTENMGAEASRRLTIAEVGPTHVHCEVPAFPTERSQLIATAKAEMLVTLDAESAGLLQQLNDERAFAYLGTGAAEATLSFRRSRDDDLYSISVKTARSNSILQSRVTESELLRIYPALRGRLPRPEHP